MIGFPPVPLVTGWLPELFFSPLSLTLPLWIHPEFWGLQFVLRINWQWATAEKILTLSLRITLRFLEANKSLTEAKKSVVSERLGCWWKLLVKDRCGLVWKHLFKPSGWHQWYHWGFCPSCQTLMAGDSVCFLPWICNGSLNFRGLCWAYSQCVRGEVGQVHCYKRGSFYCHPMA